ncbi:FAD/FMN-containing dehydrogenase [Rhizobium sp. BIGb0125]|uniref:FAD-binding oxidoreductase n=1 Tax=Rhizobium sp. BIGb0125 TaxID=2940618 RepID=UPI0021676C2A|nr:FAD-binding oxidoreductase [Rhizobium sp. BIGb0125]MCS4241775.1 FAD/FMN-containing dehydrogenase [Rhizobium sp. BIGb0125]
MSDTSALTLAAKLKFAFPDMHIATHTDLQGRDPGEHPDNFGAGILVSPSSAVDLAALVTWCREQGVNIVPHGGRTSLAGGCVSHEGQIAISTSRLNAVDSINIEEKTVTVQAGMTLQALQEAVAAYGLTTGIDLPSRGTATIGGMAATNAGGLLAFRNGVMRHQILGIEAVMPDGTIFSDLTRVVKVSAGPDIKQLLIGSEGAFGIITRLVLKLEILRPYRATAMLAVNNAKSALAIAERLTDMTGLKLEAAEMMWPLFIRDHAALRNFDLSWLPESACAFIVEISSTDEETARGNLEAALADIWEEIGILDGIVAQSSTQAKLIWVLREESGFYYQFYNNPPSFDVSLPPALLDAYVADLHARFQVLNPDYQLYVYGHIADGNLHLTVKCDEPDEAELIRIQDAIYTDVREIGGSFSAEHGVGFEKRYGYENYADPVKRSLAKQIKRALDPDGLFNPGKVPFA